MVDIAASSLSWAGVRRGIGVVIVGVVVVVVVGVDVLVF